MLLSSCTGAPLGRSWRGSPRGRPIARKRRGTDRLYAACVTISLFAVTAPAAAQSLALAPPATTVTLQAYALGMVPVEGIFYRFRGTLSFDPRDAQGCAVDLVAETASLTFADATVQASVLSPELLDAGAFPTLRYRGTCAGPAVRGELTLHGATHPLTLALKADGARIVASGTLDRTAWRITGRSFTVGRSVDIEVTAPLPAQYRGRFMPP